MSDDLKQVELEIARLKLRREQLALEDDLKKRLRKEKVATAAAEVVDRVKSISPPPKGAANWLVYGLIAFALFLLIFGGPGDRAGSVLFFGLAALVFGFRWWRRR